MQGAMVGLTGIVPRCPLYTAPGGSREHFTQSTMSDLIKPTYDELLNLVRRNYELILDPDPDSNVVDRHEIDLEHALRNAGIDTAAMQAAAEGLDEDEDLEKDRLYDSAVDLLDRVLMDAVMEHGINSTEVWKVLGRASGSFVRDIVNASSLTDEGKADVTQQIDEYVAQLQTS